MIGDLSVTKREIFFDEGHKALVQVFWSLVRLELNGIEVEKMGASGLETIMAPNSLPY